MVERTGRCQCGGVRFTLSKAPWFTAVCHCWECQRLSSSAFSMSQLVHRDDFSVEGELAQYDRSSASGRTTRCFFCPTCGNRIFHDNGPDDTLVRVKAIPDDISKVRPNAQFWMASRQPWVLSMGRGVADLPGFAEETRDKPTVIRRIALGTAWTAGKYALRAIGLVCIGIVAWQWLGGAG